MLFMLLDFKNGLTFLTMDALVDSRVCISAIAQNEPDRRKQQATTKIFKIDDPLKLQKLAANGQLEKPLETVTLIFHFGDSTSVEHFVARKNLTAPIKGSHLMRHTIVVIGRTHGLKRFPYLTIHFRNAVSEISSKPESVLNEKSLNIAPRTTKTIRDFVDHPLEWNTASTVTPVVKFTVTARLQKSHSM